MNATPYGASCPAARGGNTLLSVHALLGVGPPLPGDLDLSLRELARVLAEHVKQDDEVRRAPIQDSVELASVVAAELAQLTFDLNRTSVATLERLAQALEVRFVIGFEIGPVEAPIRELVSL